MTTDESINNLRADLMATNSAVIALLRAMPATQREQALQAFAEISAQKQALVESIPSPVQRVLLKRMQAAEERIHQAMQGAHKMQLAAERAG